MISAPQSVEQLLNAARERSPADRSAYLDHACRSSPEIRRLVEQRLLVEKASDRSTLDWSSSASGNSSSQLGFDPANLGRFAPGQVIANRFTVIRFIARGGMGEVYEAEDRYLQSVHVALKMILPEIAGDGDSSRRFEQEVLLARKVTHPNLCPIYDIARSDDPAPLFLFLTMKLLTGETLSSRLRRMGLFTREEAIAIFRQMVAGLTAIHDAGIIHRDIKPNNVMLDYSGPELCLSIMDFGLARLHEQDDTLGTRSMVAGTPGYMAPEIFQGQGPSQATDFFALGVLLHQVLTGERPDFSATSLSVETSAALDTADAPPALIHAVKEFLAKDPQRRCIAFDQLQSSLISNRASGTWGSIETSAPSRTRTLSRRQFAVGSALAACVAAGGIAWKWDSLDDLFHPLPAKRFVAVVGWPAASNARTDAMIASVIDAIGSELARAEAFDHDLLIIPHSLGKDVANLSQLNELRESLGANLVLAASGTPRASGLRLLLRILDPTSKRTLRAKTVDVRMDQQLQLPERAVRTAAELLDITRYKPDDRRSSVGTDSPEAYETFQEAEALRKQENDTGLDAAIEKYKQAIEIDPRYAVAQARLSWAYLRSYGLRRDPAALTLAGLNCHSAIRLDPSLVDAHLGLASVYRQTGDEDGASREMSNAISLDPSNPHTLIYQADFYAGDNRWSEAEDTFDRVLKLRPNYWLAHNELGAVLEDEGKYPQALMEYRSASLAAPRNAFAINNIGNAYLRLGKIPEALESLNASYQIKQDDKAAIALAEAFRLERKYPAAIGYAQSAVKLNPNEPGHWLELGDIYSAAGRSRSEAGAAYARAAAVAEEKLRTSPKNGPGWMLLALCSAKVGQLERAMTLIAKAESLHADDMDSQLYKVRTLELVGRRDDALTTIARCLSRGPTLFQLESMPDLEKLQTTQEFRSIIASTASASQNTVYRSLRKEAEFESTTVPAKSARRKSLQNYHYLRMTV